MGSNGPMRPTPIPLPARKRYEKVFNANVVVMRKFNEQKSGGGRLTLMPTAIPPGAGRRRQAAGWRGLSVDLITNPEIIQPSGGGDEKGNGSAGNDDEGVGPYERLDGRVVAKIWKASKLDKGKLREIWYVFFSPSSFRLCSVVYS